MRQLDKYQSVSDFDINKIDDTCPVLSLSHHNTSLRMESSY